MPVSPEQKEGLPVEVRPEEISEIPASVENKSVPGVTPTPTQFKAQVNDDQGNPLIQTPQTQAVTIQIPQAPEALEKLARGSTDDSKTWWAASFLRMIKKAFHFGWQIITGGQHGTGK